MSECEPVEDDWQRFMPRHRLGIQAAFAPALTIEQSLGNEIARVRHGQDVTASDLANRLMPWLAAHDAEVRAGVVAEEPEWEYGIHSEISGNVNSVGAPWMDRKFAEKVTANDSGNYGVRRRKAGSWVPVEQGDET